MTDLFPSRPEFYAEGYSQNYQQYVTVNANEANVTGNGYDESSLSFEEADNSFAAQKAQAHLNVRRTIKPSMTMNPRIMLNDKRQSDSF
jgi:hypothetical protein